MGRSRLDQRNTRKLFKTGGSTYAVTLPIEAIREMGWQENQKVNIYKDPDSDRLIVEDWDE
jgi:bifunctional DNA-binding transcriptional regulator/antitoxin component of YhaV-PrlF toxin-antitoxin module